MKATYLLAAAVLLTTTNLAACRLIAAPPLHQRIDELIAAQAQGAVAKRTSDADFLRRVSLDLAGAIPTSKETRAFLADKDGQKRTKLIDRLLASADYARRMQQAVTVMLLERRAAGTITDPQWNGYVRDAFSANRPWDQFVRELIAADGRDEKSRPGMRFLVDGGRNDHHRMTQDIARLFLGMNIQCAQCHDHPNIDDYKQADYFGLYTYLRQSKVQADKKDKKPFLIETVAKEKAEFQSVFFPDNKKSTGPRLPGRPEVEIPQFEAGREFAEEPKDGLPGVPKFRPRLRLSEDLAAAANGRFVLNSVNRFWFLMMGRGLVHPLDQMHSGNPPSHPKLLDLLAADFVAKKFDVKRLLREIALSETYQRSSVLPKQVQAKDVKASSYRVGATRPLSAEQMAWSLLRATGNLKRLRAAAVPEKSEFTYKDYINGRLPLPDNMPDVMTLFGATFGNPAGEAEVEFQPSVKHALFLMNEGLVMSWLQPHDGNLVDRLSKLTDATAIADEIYLSLLTRFPNDEERTIAVSYLEADKDRRAEAQSELAWALLTTAEFRLNH